MTMQPATLPPAADGTPPGIPSRRREPFAYPLVRVAAVTGTMGAALIPTLGPRLVAVGFGCLAAMLAGYLTLWRSRLDADERIVVWVRGRGTSCGSDMAEGLNIGAGSLYPALARLEKAGRLASRWEGDGGPVPGRPRRRLYSVAGEAHEG